MGLFRKAPKPEPIRRDQVRKMIKAGMAETDAADRCAPGASAAEKAAFRQAKAVRDRAFSNATKAEQDAAYDALNRHGY